MTKFESLKAKYNELSNERKAIEAKFQEGVIDAESWLKEDGSVIRKFAGWRRSLLCEISRISGYTYNQVACSNASNDNVDLYFTYLYKL